MNAELRSHLLEAVADLEQKVTNANRVTPQDIAKLCDIVWQIIHALGTK